MNIKQGAHQGVYRRVCRGSFIRSISLIDGRAREGANAAAAKRHALSHATL